MGRTPTFSGKAFLIASQSFDRLCAPPLAHVSTPFIITPFFFSFPPLLDYSRATGTEPGCPAQAGPGCGRGQERAHRAAGETSTRPGVQASARAEEPGHHRDGSAQRAVDIDE